MPLLVSCPPLYLTRLPYNGVTVLAALQHDIVPRFSIHNVFQMKEELDAIGGELISVGSPSAAAATLNGLMLDLISSGRKHQQ